MVTLLLLLVRFPAEAFTLQKKKKKALAMRFLSEAVIDLLKQKTKNRRNSEAAQVGWGTVKANSKIYVS